jgi:hypothetical protein
MYLVRERRHFCQSRPSRWLVLSSCADILIGGFLASRGILMAAIGPVLITGLWALVVIFPTLADFLRIRIFRLFALH